MIYRISIITYSILLIGQLFFVSLWGLGIKENSQITIELAITVLIVLFTVLLLIVSPYWLKKHKVLKKTIGLINLLLIVITLMYGQYFLFKLDLTVFLTIVIALYLISGLVLIIKMGREVVTK